jgi:hypothetical protein
MARRKSVDELLAELENIIAVWKENPGFMLGELTLSDLEAIHRGVSDETAEIESVRIKLTGMLENRDTNMTQINQMITRARSGFRAIYGPDSRQYKQAGGTPTSERKRPVRKPKTP